MKRTRKPRVTMVSLGCAKNLVDSEIILGSAVAEGFDVTNESTLADIVVINTCAFIGDAKEESIDAILTAAQSPERKLVVAGCLPQRHRVELAREIPEIDAFLSLDDVANAGKIFRDLLEKKPAGKRRQGTPSIPQSTSTALASPWLSPAGLMPCSTWTQ